VARMTKEEREAAEARRQEILQTLAELSGSQMTDDQVERKGTRLVLPETMEIGDAVEFLVDYRERQEADTEFSRTFRYRPHDGAVALQRALVRVTGTTGQPKATWTFFGKEPPELRTIPVGVNETIQVPWGRIGVPMLEGTMVVGAVNDRTWGPLFHVTIVCPRKYKNVIEGLWVVVADELETGSIYKGKAIDGQTDPDFVDLTGVDREQVIYSDEAQAQLEANIWSVLRHTEALRRYKLPRKRAVLLEGPYGTGKTLTGFLTAQEAVENGWTYLYCRPSRDDFIQVMNTARLYQPAVVFFEDIDGMSSEDQTRDGISILLDLFDGITAKGTEIMAVLTTNHKERIHKGMIRPGRLDSVIHIGALDQGGVQRMIEVTVPARLRPDELDYEAIHQAMEGYLPAFVKEAIDRAMRYSIARNNGEVSELSTEDFVNSAMGLRAQLELMEGAAETRPPDPVGVALRKEFTEVIDQSPIVDPGDNHVLTLTAGNGTS